MLVYVAFRVPWKVKFPSSDIRDISELLYKIRLYFRNLFLPINETNSEQLPASFVLHLDRPLVVSAAILEKIHSILENFKGGKL